MVSTAQHGVMMPASLLLAAVLASSSLSALASYCSHYTYELTDFDDTSRIKGAWPCDNTTISWTGRNNSLWQGNATRCTPCGVNALFSPRVTTWSWDGQFESVFDGQYPVGSRGHCRDARGFFFLPPSPSSVWCTLQHFSVSVTRAHLIFALEKGR